MWWILFSMILLAVEVEIDDIIVKSWRSHSHIVWRTFKCTGRHKLKMNPEKCLWVLTDNFLGFLVHRYELEVDKNKPRIIIDAPLTVTKKQLQCLLNKINFLRRCILNSARKKWRLSQHCSSSMTLLNGEPSINIMKNPLDVSTILMPP